METGLEKRIERLEAIEQIRQLASRYAAGLDARDLDAVVGLFVDDGRKVFYRGQDGVAGGEALKASYNVTQRRYTNSQHFVGNHVIEIDDDSHAHGAVYCRVEQELDDKWTITQMHYQDRYERHGGRWYFAERRTASWYFTEWNEPPAGPRKLRYPDRPHEEASIPRAWPSWDKFWKQEKPS